MTTNNRCGHREAQPLTPQPHFPIPRYSTSHLPPNVEPPHDSTGPRQDEAGANTAALLGGLGDIPRRGSLASVLEGQEAEPLSQTASSVQLRASPSPGASARLGPRPSPDGEPVLSRAVAGSASGSRASLAVSVRKSPSAASVAQSAGGKSAATSVVAGGGGSANGSANGNGSSRGGGGGSTSPDGGDKAARQAAAASIAGSIAKPSTGPPDQGGRAAVEVACVTVSVFRRQAATVATDNSVLIWDLTTGGGGSAGGRDGSGGRGGGRGGSRAGLRGVGDNDESGQAATGGTAAAATASASGCGVCRNDLSRDTVTSLAFVDPFPVRVQRRWWSVVTEGRQGGIAGYHRRHRRGHRRRDHNSQMPLPYNIPQALVSGDSGGNFLVWTLTPAQVPYVVFDRFKNLLG